MDVKSLMAEATRDQQVRTLDLLVAASSIDREVGKFSFKVAYLSVYT